MKNLIKSAPLPFQGQKRNMLGLFSEALKKFDPKGTYVDAFGGSGLLSNCIKTLFPDARVIWNDFDNYAERLLMVEETNALLRALREVLKDVKKGSRLDELTCIKVKKAVDTHRLVYGRLEVI